MAASIKVSEQTRDRVNDLGARTDQTADQVVSSALVEYERTLFWQRYTAASDAAAADPDAASYENSENSLWDRATACDSTPSA